MAARNMVIEKLRNAASAGSGVCLLIELIKKEVGDEVTTFAVMSLLVDAFGVSLADIRELPGARCLGGQVYENDEIEKIVRPAIQRAIGEQH